MVAHGRDSGELANFSRRTEQFEWLDGDSIGALEPDLRGRFNKALYFKDEGHLDPRAALTAMAKRLDELRVPIRFGVTLAVAPACWGPSSNARQVVDCTGLAARDALTDLRGVKGEMLMLRLRDISLSRPGAGVASPYSDLHRATRGWSVHGRCDNDRKRSADPHQRPLDARTVERGLCASPGLR